jgi:hypothetical protein
MNPIPVPEDEFEYPSNTPKNKPIDEGFNYK